MGRNSAGFTLLEVVFALAIAAVGVAAAVKATGGAATAAFEARDRMLAVWVAGNRLSELRIKRAWPAPGEQDVERVMGGRTWHLTEIVSHTDAPAIRRVEIEVYVDPQRSEMEFRAVGYVARYRPPVAGPESKHGGALAGTLRHEPGPEPTGSIRRVPRSGVVAPAYAAKDSRLPGSG